MMLRRILFLIFAGGFGLQAPNVSGKLAVVPKWSRFEQPFQSSVTYTDPLRECSFQVVFTSPVGETNLVDGFWDGKKTWRVRFRPDLPGQWKYRTVCSDSLNRGLNNQTGTFLCTAPLGANRFTQHGPVRLARGRSHFEHQDGTAFFWLSDAVWDGARLSTPEEWNVYAQTRAHQRFTAARWALAPGVDYRARVAFEGRSHITPDIEFFQEMDSKVETLNRAGLLSVIAPLWKADSGTVESVSEDHLATLMRYVVARWEAFDVAWILVPGTTNVPDAALWGRIGKSVFQNKPRVPLVLYAGSDAGLEVIKDESWVSVATVENLDKVEPQRTNDRPSRPLLPIHPVLENSKVGNQRIGGHQVRQNLWSHLLNTSSSGAAYGASGVHEWGESTPRGETNGLPLWHRSLYLPGAKQMGVAATFFSDIEFWEMRPAPELLTENSRVNKVAAAQDRNGRFSVFYIPNSRTLEISLKALPTSPIISWINPQTGETQSGVAAIGPETVTFPAPGTGDWVLFLKEQQ